ncbi:GLPGLI family protein [Aquimarina sp. 2201CG14-23]|uniref:GLPGLI family protein n=1 Tax=Aquimarina mycalae TaxID=3040073 RepID=UPI002477E207|nr:GLPGLI family protein [Aquimarina sp. 2201CG14-23]MDH7446094.1 GLPGLI family protein [Aquimarina sp. 2201CG14-23]
MKTSQLFSAIILCMIFTFSVKAQQKEKTILKVSYTTSNVSDFLIGSLKAQIKDPAQYSKVLNKISAYKIYHTLYQNLKTKESVYILDSVSAVKGMSTVGHASYTFKDSKKELFGKENFMGKEFRFKGESENLKWKISNETKEINGYNSRKAILESNPDIYVWFTTDIPVNAGPYIYYGLPGLVLESNSFFQSITASSISYSQENIFKEQLASIEQEIKKSNDVTLKEVIVKKENFKRMAEKGKS